MPDEARARHRGSEGTRLCALSDGAFAVAIGLLVVTLDPPTTWESFVRTLKSAPAIGACFALVMWLWAEHRRFFRRTGLDDVYTVVVNTVLLFVVLFYVYPLKYMATLVIEEIFGLNPKEGFERPRMSSMATLMQLYSAGFIAIFALFALLYRHAWRRREALALDSLETFDIRSSLAACAICMSIGALAAAIATVDASLTPIAGFSYFLLGPAMAAHGVLAGRRRERLEKSLSR